MSVMQLVLPPNVLVFLPPPAGVVSMASTNPELGMSGATTMAQCCLFDGSGVSVIPKPSHFQETGKRRLPAIQVTAAAGDRNGFRGSAAIPAGEGV